MKKFDDFVKFREYLIGLDTEKNPFACEFLRILPEEVYSTEGGRRYEKGALICSNTPGCLGIVFSNHRCNFSYRSGGITLNKSGELEAMCGWNSSKFKLTVKEFEAAKPLSARVGIKV